MDDKPSSLKEVKYNPAGNEILKEPPKQTKVKYKVDKNKWMIRLAVCLMYVSIVCRLIAYWGFWLEPGADETFTRVYLPIVCCIVFIVFIKLFGNKGLWTTSFPVMLIAVFLILETFEFDIWWIKAGSIFLYLVVATIYTMTVFGKIKTKWLLVFCVGTPIVYHLAFQDRTSLLTASEPNVILAWLPEISQMCFLIALLFITLAIEKIKPQIEHDPKAGLNQIKNLPYVPSYMEFKRSGKKKTEDKNDKDIEPQSALSDAIEENDEVDAGTFEGKDPPKFVE